MTDYIEDAATGCWNWSRYKDSNGYGRASANGGMDWAHRVYYRRHKGDIPEGYEIDHLCSNPPCVNPDHLEAVTRTEHVRRTWERTGRFEDCLKVTQLRRAGLTYREIAEVLNLAGKEHAWGMVQSAIKWGLVNEADVPQVRFLDADEQQEIRDLYGLGVSQRELARWYRIDSSHVSRVVNRKTSRGQVKP